MSDHLSLKIDLGRKINALLADEGVEAPGLTGKLLDLLEVEAAKPFLTESEHSRLWDDFTDLLQSSGSLHNAIARELGGETVMRYQLQVAGDHRRLKERMTKLVRGEDS